MSHRSSTAFEGLEGRQMMAAQPLPTGVIGIKIAKASVNGVALNQNRITIAFAKPVTLGSTADFRSFGYSNDLTNPSSQRKVTVGLTISQPSANVIQILTDRLIRKGSRLTVAAGGLNDTASGASLTFDASTAAKTITFAVGQNKPRYTLSNRDFVYTDLSYFDKTVFSAAPTPGTASVTPDAMTIRANLVTFMQKKVAAGVLTAAKQTAAIALYDNSDVAAIFPNANLRAALASLYGTVAEPAIQSFIGKANTSGKPWTTVDFNSGISAASPVGETKISVGNRFYTYFRPSFGGEPFQVLSAQVAHEVTRQDTTNNNGSLPDGQEESIIANAIETTVYAQQLLIDPSVAGNGTALVTRSNTRLLALLNSGRSLFPYGGILPAQNLSNAGNVFVGAKVDPGNYSNNAPVTSYENWIRREYAFRNFPLGNTPINPTTLQILQNILGSKFTTTTFNPAVETALDSGNTALVDQSYIKLATALKLNFTGTPTPAAT